MATKIKTLLLNLQEKADNGIMQPETPIDFGVSFKNVIDMREDKEHYTLEQFFDAFMSYIKETDFIYHGDTTPENSHTKIWIDTSSKQNVF